MNRPAIPALILAASMAVSGPSAVAQWSEVAPGIDYQKFTLSDPNDVYVARMDRANLDVTIDSVLGQGKLDGDARETVSSMAARREGSIGYWNQQWGDTVQDVVVAINGDFWDTDLGMPESGHIQSGWYAKRFTNFSGGSGFAWTLNRGAFIGGCVNHSASRNYVAYPATADDQNINAINLPRESGDLVLYTPQYGTSTGTDASGTEVLVRMGRPTLILPQPAYASGTVVDVRPGAGNTPIPFDHVVLSATGSAATKLESNVSPGAEIRISQEITHYAPDCSTGGWPDWTKTYASIGGSFDFLRDGVIDPHIDNVGATTRNPRTAVAFNDDYIFFIVIDGRRSGSVGMSAQEMGEFCLDTLAATDGINQDGGGSSAMWVDGTIVNQPSDGAERPTHNGLMMVRIDVPSQSTALSVGRTFEVVRTTTLRQGPGGNFGSFSTVSEGETGSVVQHGLNGIGATGESWWLVNVDGAEGWIAESELTGFSAAAAEWESY